MAIINVKIEKKIARASKGALIVCGNSDYSVKFDFDDEWQAESLKTARFVYNGTYTDIVFEGDTCPVPVLKDTSLVAVGVFAGNLKTTTPALIACRKSITDENGMPDDPTPDVYAQIMELLNQALSGGGGAFDEERVREIVEEETVGLADGVKEYVDIKDEALSQEIKVIDTILSQSGLVSKYKATIEDTYTERVTADGANVLDGSKAILEKVVGNTVKSQNLFDGNLVGGYYNNANFGLEAKGSKLYKSIKLNLPAGTYFLQSNVSISVIRNIYDGVISQDAKASKRITTQGGDIGFSFRTADNTDWQAEYKVWVTEGTEEKPYTPYFTGLKSASFGGIESKNADGTESETLNFPKTETPLGRTIDFENKKITDYGVTIVLTGEEYWGRATLYTVGSTRHTAIPCYGATSATYDFLPNYEDRPPYVATDGIPYQGKGAYYKNGEWWCGAGSNSRALYIINAEKYFGFTQFADPTNPTDEERANLTAEWKAYLKQRYADGNPVTIRYISSTLQSETDFTAEQSAIGNEYTAYNGGTETVLENDGAEYAADNTLSQNYIVVTGVK